jgi:nitrous oxidase accessory protein
MPRYGLHFMYSNGAYIENNHFTYNSVGTYLMYSTGLTVIHNNLSFNRGPSGYGIALKDMDAVIARDNWLVGNRVGLYLDNSPALYEGTNQFSANAFAYNDVGVTAHPNVERNIFTQNTFLENIQQSGVRGRGNLQGNTWTEDEVGNYWSDYVGYDADEDHKGDMPYRAEKLFENLADNNPELRFFIYSPAEQAINLAAIAFPSLRPEPKLIDTAPLTHYQLPDSHILEQTTTTDSSLLPSLLLILIGCLPFLLMIRRQPHSMPDSSEGETS